MKKIILMSLMIIVSLASFADASGSGIASATSASVNGVSYTYTFTETGSKVTFSITPNSTGVVGYVDPTNIDYNIGAAGSTTGNVISWDNLATGTIIRLTCWWAVAGGRSTTTEIAYKVGTTGNEVQVLSSFTIDKPINGMNCVLNALPIDADGMTYNGNIAYSISAGATLVQTGNSLTISTTTAGNYTITATAGDLSKTATISLINPAVTPSESLANVLAYYSDTYNATLAQNGISDKPWNWQYDSYSEIKLADNNYACLVKGAGTFGLNRSAKDITAYSKFCADIYVSEPLTGFILWESSSFRTDLNLNAGWNHIEVALTGASTNATWLQFYIGTESNHKYNYVIDNVYVSTSTEIPLSISTKDNVATVKGHLTVADVAQINAADAMNIDLTNVTEIDEGVVINPLNPNALVYVSGTSGSPAVASALYDNIVGTKNMVVKNTWIYSVNKLQFTDSNGVKQWMGEGSDMKFISTGTTGYKVTRSLKAKSFSTVYTTSVVTALPEGITAWEAVGYDGSTLSCTKANNMAAFFPYVVYNANDVVTDFSFEGTGDFALLGWSTGNVAPHTVGSASFTGNFADLTADGTQWILQNATSSVAGGTASVVFNKANGATIGAFRAYFTGLTAGVQAKFIGIDEETAGINGINEVVFGNSKVYNLNGVEVYNASNLTKGVYIMNGKKFVVK